MKKIGIIMGSDSDLPIAEKAAEKLAEYGIAYEAHVYSAHRTPEEAVKFAKCARENGFGALIALAGKAAHLPGVIASHTLIPVVGLPIKSSTMDGLDSLLSIVQMPPGIPVATVTIDSGINAALMALQIMSIKYPKVKEDLVLYRKEMEEKVLEDDKNLRG